MKKQSAKVPEDWIGVRQDWKAVGGNPLSALVTLPWKQRTKHALLIGTTGSGKTNAIHHLLMQDIVKSISVCVIDHRGDLVGAVLELCAGIVDPSRIRILDLAREDVSFGFNPLVGNGKPHFRGLSIVEAIASLQPEGLGVQTTESLLMGSILLAEAGESLPQFEEVFFNEAFRNRCLEVCQTASVRSHWQRYSSYTSDKKQTLASPVLNKISLLLATESLRLTLGHPKPLNLKEHLDQPGSILLVSLAYAQLHSAARMMGNLLISAISREVFARSSVPEHTRNLTRIYVDEFEQYGPELFAPLLVEGRKYKAALVLAHQTLSQLPPKLRSQILGNVGVKFFFRCGRADSQALSRDLTGDPYYYDLTSLPVGTAVVWRSDTGPICLEINEPIASGDVGQSRAARALEAAVYSYAPRYEQQPDVVSPENASPSEPDKSRPANQPTADLGEWL